MFSPGLKFSFCGYENISTISMLTVEDLDESVVTNEVYRSWLMFPFISSENTRKVLVFWCFREYKIGTLARNGLRQIFVPFISNQ